MRAKKSKSQENKLPMLYHLSQIIQSRKTALLEDSYTASLLAIEEDRTIQIVGEEAAQNTVA